MKTLPADFEKHGFHYRLVARAGDVALYQKVAGCWQRREHYEVFRIQRHIGREAAMRKFEELAGPTTGQVFGLTKSSGSDFDSPDGSTQRTGAQDASEGETSVKRHERLAA